jgi:aspartate aminotransferase
MVNSSSVVSAQSISGSGAVRVIAEFFKKFRPAPIYLSNPTWGNHNMMFEQMGFSVREYRYFHKETKGLDFEGMMEDLNNATPGSIIVFHTCAHNPTGVDLTLDQWKQVAQVCRKN